MANTVDRVLALAEAEVGYLEKKTKAYLDDKTANAGSNNYTKYWRDLCASAQGSAWCNAFINWIFVQAFGTAAAKALLCTNGSWSYYTPTSSGYFKNKKQWHTSKPRMGDIIYFKNSQRICHVGIIYKVDSKNIYTIEGNASAAVGVTANGGAVVKKFYPIGYANIAGFGRPKYDEAAAVQAPKVEYYPKYTGTSSSITTALRVIGVDSSYANRKKLAAANGMPGYSGTAAQNTSLLKLLKNGKLIRG